MITVQVGGRKFSIVTVLSTVAAAVAALATLVTYAGSIASSVPRGRSATDAEHERLQALIVAAEERLNERVDTSLMAAQASTEGFRNEWRCDEYEEELAELEERAADLRERGEPVPPEVTRRIERLREIIGPENMNCAQFEIDD